MNLRFLNRSPFRSNLHINSGLRHISRLYTDPKPFIRPKDFFPLAQLKIVHNSKDAHLQALMILNNVKNLFVKQLPNMGSSYITRLVFDMEAETVLILHDGQIRAGITSRFFHDQRFIEIAFCAVDSLYQGTGYGRLVMAFLKTSIQVYQIFDILACADNDAVIYFRKQGFHDQEIKVEPERWVGRIKDYDWVTLVHCPILPDVDYMNFQLILKSQFREFAKRTGIKEKRLPDLFRRERLYKFAPPMESLSIEAISDLKDDGVPSLEYLEELRQKLLKILNILKSDPKYFELFARPVTKEIAPDYYDVIHKPIDYWTLEKRLKSIHYYYKNPDGFAEDIKQMIDNCKVYNTSDSIFYRYAIETMRKFKRIYAEEFPEKKEYEESISKSSSEIISSVESDSKINITLNKKLNKPQPKNYQDDSEDHDTDAYEQDQSIEDA